MKGKAKLGWSGALRGAPHGRQGTHDVGQRGAQHGVELRVALGKADQRAERGHAWRAAPLDFRIGGAAQHAQVGGAGNERAHGVPVAASQDTMADHPGDDLMQLVRGFHHSWPSVS